MLRRTLTRRAALIGTAALALASPHLRAQTASGRLVIVGGGFGGASAARFARDAFPDLEVTLIERSRSFTTCPYGNLVLGGTRRIEQITFTYDGLARRGVRVVHDEAVAVDPQARSVRLAGGATVPYDRLIMSPGIDLRWGAIEGYTEAAAERMPHGWIPSLQPITLLERQLRAMPDGGTFVIAIPDNPFRCPPGPYERISMVAQYFKQAKPRSKILALDAKGGFSKQPLFMEAWAELYPGMIEWVGASNDGKVMKVDPAELTLTTEFGQTHRAAVANVIPPQMAARIAREAGLANASGWCPVHARSFESTQIPGIHVIGDASIAAPMPKSGYAASTHARQAVAAAVASLRGQDPPDPVYFNTCYSHVGPEYGISIVGIYRADGDRFVEVPNSGGISPRNAAMSPERRAEQRRLEALYADGWYESLTRQMFGLS
ncbi:cytochrome C [Elioraea sp. Yellowstone]|jgi:NADPH-dependent 2,4-dienoyl-CoA reductase/sulfur reductase-like enzyme|uniref:NAD(P)/FAD-dependent oxidoreductase n=1 Tax=Elioraea sp. Yellowstone TaxID=2592070 RepID=UPI00114EE5D0|nr:NAD(P)/FAD-dependent oxidoreductase [Elioraea sp. Yellowstone]TQF78334.1 cytochrome C [Elioraea sp. Yellowstone]